MTKTLILIAGFLVGVLLTTLIFYFFILFTSPENQIWATPVIQLIVNATLAIGGLALGLFYYFHKLRIENEQKTKETLRERVKYALTQFESYDSLLEQFFLKTYQTQAEFARLAHQIQRGFDPIEQTVEMIQIRPEQKDRIMAVYRFVDKSKVISQSSFTNLTNADLRDHQDQYIRLASSARQQLLSLLN